MPPTIAEFSFAFSAAGVVAALAVEFSPVHRCMRGKKGTRVSILFGYTVACVLGNAYLAGAGCMGWLGMRPSDTTAERVYGEMPYVRDHLLNPLVAHLATDLVLYMTLREVRQPALILHHIITGALAYIALDMPYCHYYILFFVGVAEVSNLPLGLMELCKLVPELKTARPQLYAASRGLFKASFFALRLVYWPLVTMRFWYDSLLLLYAPEPPVVTWWDSLLSPSSMLWDGEERDRPLHCRSRFVTAFYLLANLVLTMMQVAWGVTLARGKEGKKRRLSGNGQSGKVLAPETTIFCGYTVPTRAKRVAMLGQLVHTHPGIVFAYRLSCFCYSLTGVIYYFNLSKLPDELRATFLMSGDAFCAFLVVQGGLSYINDALGTFDLPTPPLLSRRAWNVLDRTVASTLTANAIITALQWAQSTASTQAPVGYSIAWLSAMAMCLSFVTFLPSRLCEISGRMTSFLVWHSIWHYAPNVFAVAWLLQTARSHT